MTVTAICHCGSVEVIVPRAPSVVSDCNCSICRRYGVLWAYYPAADVQIRAAPGATDGYIRGDRVLRFVRCRTCGCLTHWERVVPVDGKKMGVNARNFEAAVLAAAEVEFLDGAAD